MLNSLDEYHKKSVQSLDTPKEVYDFAIKKYGAPNAARRAQLLNSIYAISTQTNKTVQEKVDSLRNLKAELDGHKDKTPFPEEVLTQFLKISMDEEYETTIKIINNEKEGLSFEEVANRLENKETELKGKTVTHETANFASRVLEAAVDMEVGEAEEDSGVHVAQREVATPAECENWCVLSDLLYVLCVLD